jgi:hypothetical protein
MAELNIVEFDDGEWMNLDYLLYSKTRKKYREETGDLYYDTTFYFSNAQGSNLRVELDQDALDMVREAMV